MRIAIALLAAFIVGVPTVALAEDAYFISVDAFGPDQPDDPCYSLRWMSDVMFFNSAPEPVPVTLLAVSNGGGGETGRAIIVPPRTAISLFTHAVGSTWRPFWSPIGILHLDVPRSVTVSPRLYLTATDWCVSDAIFNASYGVVALPHYSSLRSANEPQVHLMTDLGSLPARVNVAVFNAGAVPATAHVEQHETCTGGLIATRDVVIEANTLVQIEGLRSRDSYDCSHGGLDRSPNTNTPWWSNYVVVTVTQPSVSYVSSIANDRFPMATLGVGAP